MAAAPALTPGPYYWLTGDRALYVGAFLGKGAAGSVMETAHKADGIFQTVLKVPHTPAELGTFPVEHAALTACRGRFNILQPVGPLLEMIPPDGWGSSPALMVTRALGPTLDRAPPLSYDEGPLVLLGLLEALQSMREAGLYHFDVKPANIFLGRGAIQLGDCGLATRRDLFAWTPKQTHFFQTPGYRDPHFVLGILKEPDLWSAACTVIECFSKKLLFPCFPIPDGWSESALLLCVTQHVLGKPFPAELRDAHPDRFDHYFTPTEGGFRFKWPLPDLFRSLRPLSAILAEIEPYNPLLADLLQRILTLGEGQISLDDALEHPAVRDIRSFNLDKFPPHIPLSIYDSKTSKLLWSSPAPSLHVDAVLFHLPPCEQYKIVTHKTLETPLPRRATLTYDPHTGDVAVSERPAGPRISPPLTIAFPPLPKPEPPRSSCALM